MQRPHWWCLRIPGIDPSLAPHQAQSERDDDPQAAFPALQEVPPSFSLWFSRLCFSPFFLVVSFVFFVMPPSLFSPRFRRPVAREPLLLNIFFFSFGRIISRGKKVRRKYTLQCCVPGKDAPGKRSPFRISLGEEQKMQTAMKNCPS